MTRTKDKDRMKFLGNPTGRLKLPDKQIHRLDSGLIRMVCEGKREEQ